ncbi:hypothetical protein ACFY6U_19485 [Streptomyces sp. NPDC013157]|uniref:hypothetical protein n=1 Tax=Streptomyces sp. NPDC013157 TaxID=3364861 RepID=UPI0036A39AA0
MPPDARPIPRALLITGTVGVGKTSVAEAMGELLAEAEIPNAVMDLDRLCQSWPTPPADRFNVGMLLRNLRCVAGHYLDAGVTRLVLAGVAESRTERDHYEEAIGIGLSVCRLRAHLPAVHQRLAHRHGDDHDGLRRHLNRAGELDRILDRAAVEDFTVDATEDSVTAVATAVLRTADWLRPSRRAARISG